MRRFFRDHSLSLVTLGAFLVIWLGGQAWAGHRYTAIILSQDS
jgi:hypothetical protein